MDYRLMLKLLGSFILVEGATMVFPVIVALIYGESPLHFLITMAVIAIIGAPLARIKRKDKGMRPRDGFMAVGLAWIALSIFGGLPFLISGEITNPADAFFETVSGFTTTGASILSDVESLSRCSLFWRSFTHWLGGMGVLVFALAILPTIGGSTQLMRAESPGPSPEKLVPRAAYTAKILYLIYLGLTVACIAALILTGMPLFDSLCNGFGTAGTGGFSIYNNGYAHYDSVAMEVVTTVFMLVFAINFTVYFRAITGNIKTAFKSQEVYLFLGIVAATMIAISINIIPNYNGSVGEAFRYGTFHVASIVSTTGFSSTDFNMWPMLSRTLLMFLMVTGACAGSTAGGMKASRILLMLKKIRCEINHMLHPRAVRRISMDGRTVEQEVMAGVMLYVMLYFVIIVVATVILSFENLSFEGCFSAVLTTVNNVGPGLAEVGPTSNFGMLSGVSKVVLSFCMLLGRLEILPILLLFTPSAWKRS